MFGFFFPVNFSLSRQPDVLTVLEGISFLMNSEGLPLEKSFSLCLHVGWSVMGSTPSLGTIKLKRLEVLGM